jgi:hypothetical protein
LCGSRIDIFCDNNKIKLSYLKNGIQKSISGLPNQQIKNNDFDIRIKVSSFSEFSEACNENKLYFQFNRNAKYPTTKI